MKIHIPQDTTVYTDNGFFELVLEASWRSIETNHPNPTASPESVGFFRSCGL